jgi:hypothetical protein
VKWRFRQKGNICCVDAKLGPLASYGGSTTTLGLLAGSPAINAVSNSANLATYQPGAARAQGPATDNGGARNPAGSAGSGNLDLDCDCVLCPRKVRLILVLAMLGFKDSDTIVGPGYDRVMGPPFAPTSTTTAARASRSNTWCVAPFKALCA